MSKSLHAIVTYFIVGLLVLQFSGCSLGWEASVKAKVTDEKLFPTVAKVIDEQKDVVWDYLQEDLSKTLKDELPEGLQIVENTLGEEHGRDYLEFCYAVSNGNGEDQVETVIDYARELVSAEEMAGLETKLNETRAIMMREGENFAKGLAPSQRVAFWKDMQKLVTRTLVLFTAGIVYAFIPDVVFWGKISAASAIAIATGIVASSVMSLWRYYQFGGNADESFNEWLMTVSTEPEISLALSTSILAMGKTLKRGPIVTGIVICVFALYNVIDMVKPMLKEYNFTV
jgi:hypothetical protein